MSKLLLDIKNLRTCYKSEAGDVWAVDDVNIELDHGEILGIVGESGCGKTTIIKSVLRLLPKSAYSEGEINFKEKDILKFKDEKLRKMRWNEISIISQSAMNALDPVYRVGDQIVEVIQLHRKKVSKKEAWERAEELFQLVGIDKGRLHDYPHQYSGGMRQRAVIAMALALDPDLILADEPTTALDVVVQSQILKRIKVLQKKMNSSMILVTHDMSVVAETCQKVVVMYGGKVVESGSVEDIYDNTSHPYTMGLKNAFPSVKGEKYELISIPGYPPSLINPPQGCRFADRCPFSTQVCLEEEPDMTTISGKHTAACHHLDKVEEMREKAKHHETWSLVGKEMA